MNFRRHFHQGNRPTPPLSEVCDFSLADQGRQRCDRLARSEINPDPFIVYLYGQAQCDTYSYCNSTARGPCKVQIQVQM